MKLSDIAVWTLAIVVGLITYLCVMMAAWVIWEPAGVVMLVLLVAPFFTPETYMLVGCVWQRRRAGKPLN
jgi:hypothetical protein